MDLSNPNAKSNKLKKHKKKCYVPNKRFHLGKKKKLQLPIMLGFFLEGIFLLFISSSYTFIMKNFDKKKNTKNVTYVPYKV